MARIYIIIGLFLLICIGETAANNVRVTQLNWSREAVSSNNIVKMTCTVEWDNSWRDAYNHDAVYLFFKIKKKDVQDALQATEEWQHLYLADQECEIREGEEISGRYGYWLCPLGGEGNERNVGVYLFRNANGRGDNSMQVTLAWNITHQKQPLTSEDVQNNRLLISAHAIEMVYVPGGAFRVGDNLSENAFRSTWFPILPEYDVVSPICTFLTNEESEGAERVGDRVNDNSTSTQSMWIGRGSEPYIIIDFGEGNEKTIRYFGVNSAKSATGVTPGIPTTVELSYERNGFNQGWNIVESFAGDSCWSKATDAYPVEKAVRIKNPVSSRRYRIVVKGMKSGSPVVTSIGMTEQDLASLNDYTTVIDGTVVSKDSIYGLCAADSVSWTGNLPTTFPNGFRDFYAMKYEITQEQYVGFLNKLTFEQQNTLLDGLVESVEEGGYLFGDGEQPAWRNGIVLSTRIAGMPAVFACNLSQDDGVGSERDGQEVACNYMCVSDMLAYADWACLRPLTELEYEKMARPPYPYKPTPGEFAWGTTSITAAGGLTDAGMKTEKATGNANFQAARVNGALRAGVFAGANTSRENAGAGYWGNMELSGNLAEYYYNVTNPQGLILILQETMTGEKYHTAHGDGYVGKDGRYNGSDAGKKWGEAPTDFALRGGSFQTDASALRVSDRSAAYGFVTDINVRDSSASFRLGRSLPQREELVSLLILENGESTEGRRHISDTGACNKGDYYIIRGNNPAGTRKIHSYIWKIQSPGGRWKVLDGACERDLIFRDFRKDCPVDQVFRFMRIVTTASRHSEQSSSFYGEVVFKKLSNE